MDSASYCSRLKAELCRQKPTGCCRTAECYGLLLFGRSFSRQNISICTKSRETAELYASLLKICFGVHAVTDKSTVDVPGEADRSRIINFYEAKESDWILNPNFVKRTCCRRAFIRGAFLACGSVNDPKVNYHLEFAVKDATLAFAFAAFLELCGHKPKKAQRESVTALYYNDSSAVEELLGSIGADRYSLELMEVKVVRDMRNTLNRKNNFDTANISKTVDAAMMQNEAIKYLEKINKLCLLPPELIEAATLRRQNPEASLTELCKIAGEKISRSGMNHRLKKIIDTAIEQGCDKLVKTP